MNGDAPIPAEPAAASSPPVFPLSEVSKGGKAIAQWTLTLYPTHLALADAPGAQPYIILRDQLMKSAILLEGARTFVIKQPREIMFRLPSAAHTALADWIGKPFLAAFYLKRRFAWIWPWAALWVFGWLMSILPSSRPTPVPRFGVTPFVLSVGLLVAWAFSKWRPHPVLFLIDSFWFGWMATGLVLGMFNRGWSKWWFILVAMLVLAVINGVRHFIRFRGTKIVPLPASR